MKYISLLMVAIIVALSWFLMRPNDGLSAEQHARLQQVMTEYLTAYLKETHPDATEVQEPQVTTRVLESGRKMQAVFKLAYNLPGENGAPQKITREGNFALTSDNGQDWTAKMERMEESQVEFPDADAISITLNDSKAAAGETSEAEQKENKGEKPAGHPAGEPAPAH